MAEHADIVIVGAGAAGLAASIFAAETNSAVRVVLLDGAKTIGAKILVSGGGRCNVTNQKVTASDFHGNRKIIDRILRRFDEHATMRWLEALGVPLHTENTGKVFPVSNSARTVLHALLQRCAELGVTLLPQHRVFDITKDHDVFVLHHSQGTHRTKNLILATGGQSLPKTGSDGSGWALTQHLGHTLTLISPALVPLLLDPSFFHANLSGTSHDVMLTTRVNHKMIDRRCGSLLWTHFGISGPVVLDASRFWVLAEKHGHNVQLHLNCFPEFTPKDIEKWLIQAAALPGRKTVESLLAERLPTRVATHLVQFSKPSISDSPANLLSKDSRRTLVHVLTDLPLPVIGSRGWNFAEVTAGGIPLTEINPHSMASKTVPGLYLIGEMLDCDGRIGGFNFQWAWSTGYLAGQHAARAPEREKSFIPKNK